MTVDTIGAEAPTLSTLVTTAYDIAASKGFHDDDNAVTLAHRLMLIVGEVNEAFEEHRSGHAPTDVYFTYDVEYKGVKFKGLNDLQVFALFDKFPDELALAGKPEGVPVEIADTVIRLLDFCGTYGIDLEGAVTSKMAFNQTRPFKHGRTF